VELPSFLIAIYGFPPVYADKLVPEFHSLFLP
jgi:hypothetical protein